MGRPAGRIGQPVGRSIEPSVNQGGRQAVHLPVRPSNSQSVSQSVLMEVAGVCIGGCWRLLEVAEGCIRDCWRMPRIWRVVPSVTPQLSARPVPKHCFGLNPSFRCGRCTAQKHWSTTTHAEVGEPDEAVNDDEVRPADVQEVGAALGFVLPPRPNVSCREHTLMPMPMPMPTHMGARMPITAPVHIRRYARDCAHAHSHAHARHRAHAHAHVHDHPRQLVLTFTLRALWLAGVPCIACPAPPGRQDQVSPIANFVPTPSIVYSLGCCCIRHYALRMQGLPPPPSPARSPEVLRAPWSGRLL